MARRAWGGLLVLFLLSLASPPARADADPLTLSPDERTARAKALFEQGRAHVDLGDYAAATSEFEQAYVLRPLPIFLFNLAELAVYQDHREHALQLYGRYLQTERDPRERAQVERRIAELRRSLQKNPEPPPEPTPIPTATVAAPVPTVAPAAVVAASPAVPPHRSRRWLWAVAAGGAVIVGGAIALGVVLGTRAVDPTPSLGTSPLHAPRRRLRRHPCVRRRRRARQAHSRRRRARRGHRVAPHRHRAHDRAAARRERRLRARRGVDGSGLSPGKPSDRTGFVGLRGTF